MSLGSGGAGVIALATVPPPSYCSGATKSLVTQATLGVAAH